ncbi:ExeA family protein [uncultured Desulfovibrio sp.]|uniref:ExeA family protein n=1 Tax=uncultured Desulfovibrio sp. TaxID=167968 RepID=UPI002670A4CD|nr:AAA family ATPase [uncultured Desulfovibrio sp.]
MRQLGEILSACAPSRRKLAEELGMAASAVTQLLNHGTLPKRRWPEIRERLLSLAEAHGTDRKETEAALKELEQQPAPAPENKAEQEEEPMILRKQTLTMQARQTFGLVRNPFVDPETSADVFMSPDIRFARETLYQAATGSGFLALVGESGSGKSTLKDELITRISTENLPVIVIEPYTLAMAASESQGKPLRSSHIAEAIISTVQPGAKIPSSPEMRFRRLHEILKASHTAGMRHCLIIEEAHDLHRHTLKSLKRFHELKDGLSRLLSIILIGQTELEKKLRVTDASVREVVQRCDVVHLSAIADPGAYLRHRFERAGADFTTAFSPDGIEEIRLNLTVSPDSRGEGVYMGYPLMIANLATAALNLAAGVGERQVTADVVRMVRQ